MSHAHNSIGPGKLATARMLAAIAVITSTSWCTSMGTEIALIAKTTSASTAPTNSADHEQRQTLRRRQREGDELGRAA